MRHRTFLNGGYDRGGVTESGGTASGPVILYRDPLSPREAATKQYVDQVASDLDAAAFTRGTINPARIPSFTGDITKTDGSESLTLNPTGVVPGVYSKYQVNSQGCITSGLSLTISDIPDLPWGKVRFNTPTTVGGYGITNALTYNGGVFTGHLTLNYTATDIHHLLSKKQLEELVTDANRPGDIVLLVHQTAPRNYLECNGAQVSIFDHYSLYSVIGTLFNPPGGAEVGKFTLPTRTSDIPGTKYYIKC